jgi:hypothetical protein
LNRSISVPIYYAQLPLVVACSSSSGSVDSRVIDIEPKEKKMACGGYMGYPPRKLIVSLFNYMVL